MTKRPSLTLLVISLLLSVQSMPAKAELHKDAVQDSPTPNADLASVSINTTEEQIEFVVETTLPYTFGNTQLLLDADNDATTGFADGNLGFDVLVEGKFLFAFKGDDPSQWSWQRVGEAACSAQDNHLTVRLPWNPDLPSTCLLVVRTLDDKYVELDRIPDTGAMRLTGQPMALLAKATKNPPKNVSDATRDLVDLRVSQDGAKLVVEVATREPSDFGQLLVFFDTDCAHATGYHSDYADRLGFDALLSGARLHSFNGQNAKVWAWEAQTDAKVSVSANRYRAEFNAAFLKSKQAAVVAMMMSADWQNTVDRFPADEPLNVSLDTTLLSKLRNPAEPAAPRANRNLPPRQRVKQAKSFYCYYGSGKVAALSHYDVVIAHSPQMQPDEIAALKNFGVVTVGYLSVGEDDKLRKANGKGPGGYASWYFDKDKDNQPDQNGIWKSYYANSNDPAWRADRVAEAKRLCNGEGYDGIFLDTIDTAAAFPSSEPGMIKLVNELRQALPNAPIVLNQGFPMLAKLAPMADGLMIESFTATYDFRNAEYVLHTPSSLDWTRGVAQRIIDPVLADYPLRVMVLDYTLPDELEKIKIAADRAATFGYLFAAAPIHLDAVYSRGITGEYDAKWLRRQATPDAMKFTLDQPTNGFPSQTVVLPSGCYSGYKVNAVVDGIRDRTKLHWADAAWASSEDGDEAWLEFQFPQPLTNGDLVIHWAVDSGRIHASKEFEVQVLQGSSWKTIDQIKENTEAVTVHALPGTGFDALRIRQAPGGGSIQRPNLMWIAQVERRPSS